MCVESQFSGVLWHTGAHSFTHRRRNLRLRWLDGGRGGFPYSQLKPGTKRSFGRRKQLSCGV